MRKIFATLALVSTLSLGACATAPDGTKSIDPQQIQNVITQIQAVTRQVCNFVPTATTVANIIGTFTGIPVGGVTAVANGICNAINQPVTLGRRGARKPPTYRGVVIKGRHV